MTDKATTPLEVTISLLGQFTSHGGGVNHNIVQFVLAGIGWGSLLWFSLYRRSRKQVVPHENLLVWGFCFGLTREIFMLSMALLQSYGVVSNEQLHIFFPPIEHALLGYAMVIICGSYIRYLLEDIKLSHKYILAGIMAVTICYLATFWWWGQHIIANPTSKFGQTWCDWIFRINSSVFIIIAMGIIYTFTRGWTRNVVCLALAFFFLHEFLKIPDMVLNEVYESQITPFRHGFYLLGIPLLAYVYIREQFEMEELLEKKLSRSEQVYRSLVENINLGISLIAKDRTIMMSNKAQHNILGKPAGYLTGRKCYEAFVKKDDICAHCPGTKAMETGEAQEIDVDNIRPDGTPFTVRLKAFPVFDKNGNAESFIEVVDDVTERLKMEEELQQTRNLESIGVLAGGIAHDFNNILASIFGFTDLALLKLKKQAVPQREIEQIKIASHRARDLVQQILTISRKQQQEKKPLRIADIIIQDLKLLRATIPTTIEIKQDIRSTLPILADPVQINQLIMNLCTNAYQAMAETGGTLGVSLDEMSIKSKETLVGEHVLVPGNYVRLAISDTGPGMTQEIKKRIFEPYFTTKETSKGTGLGLAVVMGIVKSHGGKINVYSEVGEGTSFSIYLPVAEENIQNKDIESNEDFEAHGDERIMVVDDEKDIRISLNDYLTSFGYQVDTFEQGMNAWQAFAEDPGKWDLLITDQTMPGMTGADLVKNIRKVRSDFPVILCTGYSEILNKEKAMELGIRSFLHKPVVMNELLRAVRTTLDNSEKSSTAR